MKYHATALAAATLLVLAAGTASAQMGTGGQVKIQPRPAAHGAAVKSLSYMQAPTKSRVRVARGTLIKGEQDLKKCLGGDSKRTKDVMKELDVDFKTYNLLHVSAGHQIGKGHAVEINDVTIDNAKREMRVEWTLIRPGMAKGANSARAPSSANAPASANAPSSATSAAAPDSRRARGKSGSSKVKRFEHDKYPNPGAIAIVEKFGGRVRLVQVGGQIGTVANQNSDRLGGRPDPTQRTGKLASESTNATWIEYDRSGGFTGQSKSMTVLVNGEVTTSDGTQGRLTPAALRELRGIVNKCMKMPPRRKSGGTVADGMQRIIKVNTGTATRSLDLSDGMQLTPLDRSLCQKLDAFLNN